MAVMRAKLNPTEALIPKHLEHYMDAYDRRWRGDKPYIGAGHGIREQVSRQFRAAVLRLHPGAQITWRGMDKWVETLFPGYDPDIDDCLCVMAMVAADKLAKGGYLVPTFGGRDDDWTRTRLPPFGPDCLRHDLYGDLIEQWRRRDTALLQAGFAERGPPVPLSEEERQRQEGLIEEHLRARAAAEEKRKQEAAEEVAAKKRRREEGQARELERYWKYRKKESEPWD
jgi:hypothetical protein